MKFRVCHSERLHDFLLRIAFSQKPQINSHADISGEA